MTVRIGGGLPATLTAERIKTVLALAKSHERILRELLDANASQSWKSTNCGADFYDRLWALLATVEGRKAYNDARSEFENQKPKWRGRVNLFQRLLEDCTNTLSNQSSPIDSSLDSQQDQDLVPRLANVSAWEHLAEVVWAKSLIFGEPDHLLNALTTYPEIRPHLEVVQTGLIQENGENILLDLEEEEEAGQLVYQVKRMVEQLVPDHLNEQELQVLSQHVERLTAIARIRSHRDHELSMLRSQIECWEQSRSEEIGNADTVRCHLPVLKTSVENGIAKQNTVTAALELADKLLSIEARYRKALKQASFDADIVKARPLLDTLESLIAERDEANLDMDALLDVSSSGHPHLSTLDAMSTTTDLKRRTDESKTDNSETETPVARPKLATPNLTGEIKETDTETVSSVDDKLFSPPNRPTRPEDSGPGKDLSNTAEKTKDDVNRLSHHVNEAVQTAIDCCRFGLAYHLALSVSDASPCAGTIKLVACNYVTDRRMLLRAELSDLAGELLSCAKSYEDNSDSALHWRDEAVLAACAALVPALKAPGGLVAQLLTSLEPHLSDMPSLRKLATTAAQVSMTGVDLPISSLRENDTLDEWSEKESTLRTETANWLANEHGSTIKYQAATRVWQRMLENWEHAGRTSLGHLFTLLDKPAEEIDVDQVAELTEFWRANHEKEIDRIDRENRRRAATKKIEGSARLDIREKVNQALVFSDRWLSLINERPDKRLAFPTEQAKLLRTTVIEYAEPALNEIAAASFTFRNSAAALLRRYKRLFVDSNEEQDEYIVNLMDLLHAELLADPKIEFDAIGNVVNSSLDVATLQTLLSKNKLGFAESAIARAQRGDFRGAEAAIEYAERTGQIDVSSADLSRVKIDDIRSHAKQNLEDKIRETSDRLDAAYAAGALTLTTYERLSGDTPLPDSAEADAFNDLLVTLEQIDNEIFDAQKGRCDALSRSLRSLDAQRHLSSEDKGRIEQAITNGLFQVAEDFIERIERGEQLPTPDAATDHPFDRFFPHFVEKYAVILNDEKRGIQHIRALVDEGDSADLTEFKGLSDGARRDAIRVLDAWVELCNSRTSIPSLTALMKSIGFVDAKINRSGNNTFGGETVFRLQTASVTGRDITRLPDFGSGANGRYQVFAIRGRVTEESIIRESSKREAAGDQPSIVLFLGILDIRARQVLARNFRSGDYHPTIVLDEALAVFLSACTRNRLGAFFDCASAFTFSQPFDPDAADVPPEMFFGRTNARKAILATSGNTTHFLYGGRRLGKTALLSSIAREYRAKQKREPRQIVLLINLKGSGIGENRPTEDLWTLFSKHLSEQQILQPQTVRHESIERGVRHWLDDDQRRRILLLVDEADAFLDAERSPKQSYRVLDQVKRLMEQTERRFKVVFTGLHNVQRAARDPNTPFAHLGDAIRIGPMLPETDQNEIQNLIRYPIEALGYRFTSNDSVIRIAAETNYYPALAQQFCKELLKDLCDDASIHSELGPPYPIYPETVDRVFNARETRDRIRNLFSWTIQLDPRYEFLTYLIAQKSFDNEDARPHAVAITDIRDSALSEWREGFISDSSYWMFEVLLEEMVGLGILREASDKHYAIRTRNLRMLLGNDDEIERRFVDAKSKRPPAIFDPAQFRSTLPDGTPSSLTADQERRLLSGGRQAVGLVFGTRLAGLDRIGESLEKAGQGRDRVLHIKEVAPASMLHALRQVSRSRKPGIHVVLTDIRGGWDLNLIERTFAFVGEHDFQNRLIRPVFLCGPDETWKWLKTVVQTHEHVERRDVWLGPCALEFTRNWLTDRESQAYSSMENVGHAFDHPWPKIVGVAAQDKHLTSIKEAADTVWLHDDELDHVTDILISDNTKAALRLLLEFPNESITADFLLELLSEEGISMSPEEVNEIFNWADRLGIIHIDGSGYRMDSIYAGGLARVFEG